LSQCKYFGPRNFSVFASYYTETLLYSNFHGPLFSRTCQAHEIREIKGARKKRFYSIAKYCEEMPTKITLTGVHFQVQYLYHCSTNVWCINKADHLQIVHKIFVPVTSINWPNFNRCTKNEHSTSRHSSPNRAVSL